MTGLERVGTGAARIALVAGFALGLLALGWFAQDGAAEGTGRAVLGNVLPQDLLPSETTEEAFQSGNRLYQEGDFGAALEAYLLVLEDGFSSPVLFYNLGNAYFKTGDLGRSILNYERALRLDPRDPDTRANLSLARSLAADEIEPLPRFWPLVVTQWWVSLLPRSVLVFLLVFTYLLWAAGLCMVILSRSPGPGRIGGWLSLGGAFGVLLLGTTLLAREGVLGGADWGIVVTEVVSVQSAPSQEADLTIFLVHEGTKARIDQESERWLEIVLEDGKMGWVPADAVEII